MTETVRLRPQGWAATRGAVLGGAFLLLAGSWLFPPIYVSLALASLIGTLLILRFPVAGLCLLALSVPWGSGFAVTVGGFPASPTEVLVVLTSGAWLASALAARRNPIVTSVWLPFLVLFLVAISLSATGAADSRASMREIVKWIELALVYLAAAWSIDTRRDVQYVVAAVVCGGVSQAILGYLQFAFQLGPDAFIHGQFLRAYGSFDQPNPFAGYLNMVLPLGLAMAACAPSLAQRRAYSVASVAIGGAVLASESRGALLASLAAGVVVAVCVWPRLSRLVWAGGLALAAGAWGAALNVISLGPFQRVLTAIGLGSVSFGSVTTTNFSAVERAAHWLAGVRMFEAHPVLGVGIGNYADAYPAYHPRGWYAPLAHAHNYYINIAAESGLVGLTAYVLLLGSALWYSYATMRRAEDPVYRAALLGLLGALVATGLHNLFDVLYVHGTVALLGLLMAFVPVAMMREGRTLAHGSIAGWTSTTTET